MFRSIRSASSILAVAFVASACSTAPAPKEADATPKNLPTRTALASQMPTWYQQQPPNTSTELYVVGTAKSADLGMVETKAVMDAQTKLSFKLKGEMDAITKDYKRDSGGGFDQTTEQASKRVALGVDISGYTVVNRLVLNEGEGFRSYVLLKYPLGEANPIPKNADTAAVDNPVTEQHSQELHQELANLKKARAESKIPRPAQTPPTVPKNPAVVVPVQQGGGIVVKVTPADESEED